MTCSTAAFPDLNGLCLSAVQPGGDNSCPAAAGYSWLKSNPVPNLDMISEFRHACTLVLHSSVHSTLVSICLTSTLLGSMFYMGYGLTTIKKLQFV